MHCLGMKKAHDIACRSDWACRRPFEFEQEHRLISHATRSAKDRFDSRVDRFDHAEPNRMIAVGGDAVDVCEEEVPQPLYLWEALPSQGFEPSHQEIEDTGAGLIGPQTIELLPQDIRFEQPAIGGEQRLQFRSLRAADR